MNAMTTAPKNPKANNTVPNDGVDEGSSCRSDVDGDEVSDGIAGFTLVVIAGSDDVLGIACSGSC